MLGGSRSDATLHLWCVSQSTPPSQLLPSLRLPGLSPTALCFYITFYLPAIGGFYFKSPSEGLSPMSPHSEPLPELALTSRTAAAGVLLCSMGQMPRDKALLLLCTLFLRALLSLRIPQFGQSARCFQVQVVTLAADGTTSGTDMREEKQNSD